MNLKVNKLYLLSILLCTNVLLSADSTQELLDKGKYEEGCALAEKIYLEEPASFNANLYYGICAHYRKDIDAAMAAFDRAEILDEDNVLVHKYLGNLYATIGNIDRANEHYDKADRLSDTPVTRANIDGHDSSHFSLLLRISAGIDSNARYDAELSDLSEWFGAPVNSVHAPKSVFFAQEYLALNHVYQPDPYSQFYLKTQLHAYNKNFDTFHDQDLALAQVLSGPGWASKTFDFWFPVSYTYAMVDYEGFSDKYSIEPQIRKRFDNELLLTMKVKYEMEKYKLWEKGDQIIYAGDVFLSRWFGDNNYRLGYAYFRSEKKDEDSPRIFIDRDYNEISLVYTGVTTPYARGGFGYLYRESNYKDLANVALPQTRKDKLQQYSAYFSYDLTETMGLIFKYEYYDNKSNYIPADYIKEVISAGLDINL